MAMDELCCFALVVAQLPDSGEIEERQVNLFHKIWNSYWGENNEEMFLRSDNAFHCSGHNGSESGDHAAQACPDHHTAARR
jgi:hypothetical protein